MLDLRLEELRAGDRLLAKDIRLRVMGGEKGGIRGKEVDGRLLQGQGLGVVLGHIGGLEVPVSHDRKYLAEVCGTLYRFTEKGLVPVGPGEL